MTRTLIVRPLGKTYTWNTDCEDELALARELFSQSVSLGMGVSVDADGTMDQIAEFDPDKETIIIVHPLAGG